MTSQDVDKKQDNTKISTSKKIYRISPKRKKLMASINIAPTEYEDDERAKYILSK